MIVSDRQHTVSLNQLRSLEEALSSLTRSERIEGTLRAIEEDALRSQIDDVRAEIAEYELLKSGAVSLAESFSLADLPRALIQARILKGWSQTALADQLRLKPQQIQRYEATDYMSASLSRLIDVATVLDVRVSESFGARPAQANSLLSWNDASDVDWSKFPVREMARRGWIQGADLVEAVREWFQSIAGPSLAPALHRKKVRGGGSPDEYALLAWQVRVLQLASAAIAQRSVGPFALNDTWLPKLVALTNDPHGPRKASALLAEHGIALVVARHLPGTYLDGAAMLSPLGTPVVALTLRYDRLDNFWFVLLHELGHVFLHLHGRLKLDFFDEDVDDATDPLESAADAFALDTLVAENVWNSCVSRFARTREAVELDARRIGVGPGIIAGRIRKELRDFTILSDLVGNGQVRGCFSEDNE